MISQTGFRPSARVLGAVVSLSPSFPAYIDSYSPVYPYSYPAGAYPVGAYPVVAPDVTVPAPAPNGYASTTTMLVVGGLAITGAALLLTALARK